MGIGQEFLKRLDRSLERAKTTAQNSTLNKTAWRDQARDLAAMRRLLQEAGLFLDATEKKAESRYYQAKEQEQLDIDQAEDLASAKLLADNRALFERSDVGTVKAFLVNVDPAVLAEAVKRLPLDKQMPVRKALLQSE